MARRDVDLVIRAKDEAEKVVKSITAAINDFTDAQRNLTSKSEGTESSMRALGSAYAQLKNDLRGGSAADVLAKSLDKANASVERIEKSVQETRGEVTRLDADFRSSSAGVEAFRTRLASSAAALDKARGKLKTYKAGLAEVEKEARDLAKAERDLKIGGIEKQLEAKAAAAQKTEARIAQLRAEIDAADKPTKRLTNSLATNTRRLSEQQTELASLTGRLTAARDRQAELARRAEDTANKIKASTIAIQQQEGVVAGLGTNYARIATETKEAEKSNEALKTALDKTNSTLERQEQQLGAAQNELKQFAASSEQAEAAIKELSTLSIKGLDDDLTRQRRAMLETKREYIELTARATELAGEMGRVGVPTREVVQDFERLKIEAKAAKAELAVQRETLERMGRAFDAAGTDMEGLTIAQREFVNLQGRAGSALQEIRTRAESSTASLNKLHAGYQKVADASGRVAPNIRSSTSAMSRELTVSEQLARAYRNLYGEKRRALSLTQRLRGEVLSLVAAYGGLYGVIEVLRRTVDAYKQVEAAQARLNVAFDGNTEVVAQEMDFLRRNAERLGVEFGVLATEYSKFSIATKNTALEGDPARKLFLQIAEAARVNRSSMEEMAGVFTAVTQIVNKGAVQMEELRQQLGDRLPGAIQLMADGLGVTTAELVKMMEQGQVTADALVPFGNELEKRFGPQLADSLTETSAEMGRLQNAAFNALRTFGEAGFIDAFTDLVRTLTETLQSADAEAFIVRLSSGFEALFSVIGFAVENFQLLAAAAGAFVGVKLIPFLGVINTAFTQMKGSLVATHSAMATTQVRAAAMGVSISRSAIAVRGLSAALKGLLSSTGLGLLLVGVSTAIGYWSTEADKATEALTRHREIVDTVRNAYDETSGSVEKWREAVANSLSITEARKNLRELEEALQSISDDFDEANRLDGASWWTTFFGTNLASGASADFNRAVEELVDKVGTGEVKLADFREELDKINEQYRDGSEANRRYAEALDEEAKRIEEAYAAYEEARLTLEALTGTADDAQEALDDLNGVVEDSEDAFTNQKDAVDAFNAAMETLRDTLPESNDEMAKLAEETAKIETALDAALTAARALPDAIMRIAAEQEALAAANAGLLDIANREIEAGVSGSLVDRIIGVESGGNPTARNPNSTATGLGQFIESTWLRMFKEHFPDRAAGMTNAAILALREDAAISRQMVQLYLEENARHLQAAGVAITDANLYLAHFLGPGGATSLINSAPGTLANNVLSAGQVNANQSILDGKTREEVIAWAQRKVGISERELAVVESIQETERRRAEQAQEAAERQAEAQRKFHEQTNANIAQQQFELSIADQEVIAREQALAIREAELAAQEAGTELTEQQRQAILANVEAKFREQQAEDRLADSQERRAEAEERVNRLMEYRESLQTQLQAAIESGDTTKAEELRAQIEGVNQQLEQAITNAQQMWEALGGEEGDAATARLEALRIRAAEFGNEADNAFFSWQKVGDLLVNGLASAFDTFAQGIAEGKSATEAARDAFLQFASDFLLQIARMIIQQAIFNALKGTGIGNFLGIGVGTAHSGGRIGSSRAGSGNASRRVNPAVFAGAMRFHKGGIPGLRPGEVPIIAQENEEVLTRDDPRHILNGGGKSGGQAAPQDVKIVNAIDGASFLEQALSTAPGQRVLMNFMRANRDSINRNGA